MVILELSLFNLVAVLSSLSTRCYNKSQGTTVKSRVIEVVVGRGSLEDTPINLEVDVGAEVDTTGVLLS